MPMASRPSHSSRDQNLTDRVCRLERQVAELAKQWAAAPVGNSWERPSARSRRVGDSVRTIERQVAVRSCAVVQMLWGERRGHGTIGAIQRLPMELPHVVTLSF